jgi:hypothetical protein
MTVPPPFPLSPLPDLGGNEQGVPREFSQNARRWEGGILEVWEAMSWKCEELRMVEFMAPLCADSAEH